MATTLTADPAATYSNTCTGVVPRTLARASEVNAAMQRVLDNTSDLNTRAPAKSLSSGDYVVRSNGAGGITYVPFP